MAIKVLILSCNTGGGHNAAGQAVYEELCARGVECEFADALAMASPAVSQKVSDGYVFITTKAPEVFKLLYKAGGAVSRANRLKHKSPVYFVNKLYADKLQAYIESNGFDVVVMPHLFPAEAMTVLKRQGALAGVRTVAVGTDYTCIPFWEETDPDWFVIPHADLAEEFAGRGIPAEKLLPLGIPVKRGFREPEDKAAARAALGLPEGGPLYLVMTGSMGFGNLESLLEAVAREGTPAAVLCGSNDEMRERLERKFAAASGLHFRGYTREAHRYMAACDVLFTKPGGLTSTEAAAVRIPVVHTSPIPGCETLNARFFAERGMSVVGEDAEKAVRAAAELACPGAARDRMLAAQAAHVRRETCGEICDLIARLGAEGASMPCL